MAEAGSLGVFTSTEEAEWNEDQGGKPRQGRCRGGAGLSKARSEELARGSCTGNRVALEMRNEAFGHD